MNFPRQLDILSKILTGWRGGWQSGPSRPSSRNVARRIVLGIDAGSAAIGVAERFLDQQVTRLGLAGGSADLAARAYAEARKAATPKQGYPTIGIPTALYLAEEAPFWQAFLELLGFPTLLAAANAAALREDKRLAGAEFCAPMAMFHGQASAQSRTRPSSSRPIPPSAVPRS